MGDIGKGVVSKPRPFNLLQGKILILLTGVILLFSLSLYLLSHFENQHIEKQVAQAIPKEQLAFTQLLNQKAQKDLERYLNNESFWKSWWNASQSQNALAADSILLQFTRQEGLAGAWFYSEDFRLLSSHEEATLGMIPRGIPETRNDLQELFNRPAKVRYFTLTRKGNLVEIIGSHFSGVDGRQGYFLTARVWTASEMDNISRFLKVPATLEPFNIETRELFKIINPARGIVSITIPLYDWNYRPVAFLNLQTTIPWIQYYFGSRKLHNSMVAFFALVILGIIFLSLRVWITQPLKVMAANLQDNVYTPLKPGMKSTFEVARLSAMLEEYLRQKDALHKEIQQRQEAETELRARERFLDTLIGNLTGMVYRCKNDREWTMEFVSEGTQELTGYTPAELLNNQLISYASLIIPEDQEMVWQGVQKAMANPENPKFELLYRIRRRDGEIRWVWEHGKFIFTSDNRPLFIEGFIRDVTNWKQAEAELRSNFQRMEFIKFFHETLQEARDLPTLIQKAYQLIPQFTQVNRANVLLYDPKENSLISDQLIGVTHPAEPWMISSPQPLTLGISGKCFREDKPAWEEDFNKTELVAPDILKKLGIISCIAVPIHGKERILGVLRLDFTREKQIFKPSDIEFYQIIGDHLGLLMDNALLVTELKTSEAQVRERESQYHQAITQIKAVPYRFSYPENKFTFMGPEIAEVTGYSAEEFDSPTWQSLIQDVLVDGKKRAGTQAEAFSLGITPNQTRWKADYRILNRQGEERWISDTALIIRDENSNPVSCLGILEDITERKEAESRLAFLTRAMEQSPNSVMITNTHGNIEYVNPTFTKLTGYQPEEAIGKNPRLLKSGKVPEETYRDLWATITSGNHWEGELINRKKNGDYYYESAIISPVRNKEGEVTHYAAVMVDITEKKYQEKIKNSISSLGHKLSSLAHPKDVGTIILMEASELFGWDAGLIATWQPVNDTFDPLLAMIREDAIPKTVSVGEAYHRCENLRQTVKEGKLLINREPESDAPSSREFREFETFCQHARSLMFAPIRRGDKVIGVLSIQNLAEKAYQPRDLELFQILADHCAGALERTVAEESLLLRERELSVQLRFLTSLRTIDLAIISSMDLRLSLNVILSEILVQLDAEAANILLLSSFSTEFDYLGNKGFKNPALAEKNLRLGEGYPGKTVRERKAVYIESLAHEPEDSRRQPLLALEGFIGYAAVPLYIKGEIKGVLELFTAKPLASNPQWQYFLEALSTQTAIAIENSLLFENLQKSNTELALAYDTTLEGWSRALDLRDQETEGHTQRVTELTLRLAKRMEIPEEKLTYIRWGALLHDIGKMGIPDNILLKQGALTSEERKHMEKHTDYAFQFLYPIEYLRPALDIPYCHHEKWDGTGYPRQLKGDKIPIAARIFAVVDVWDALHYDRPYRKGLPSLEVLQYIESQKKMHFDPVIVDIFLEMMKDESLWG
jgi:PAS domain S-box-containing protein/putative nucleotidyltransferase with HDIG domain